MIKLQNKYNYQKVRLCIQIGMDNLTEGKVIN